MSGLLKGVDQGQGQGQGRTAPGASPRRARPGTGAAAAPAAGSAFWRELAGISWCPFQAMPPVEGIPSGAKGFFPAVWWDPA